MDLSASLTPSFSMDITSQTLTPNPQIYVWPVPTVEKKDCPISRILSPVWEADSIAIIPWERAVQISETKDGTGIEEVNLMSLIYTGVQGHFLETLYFSGHISILDFSRIFLKNMENPENMENIPENKEMKCISGTVEHNPNVHKEQTSTPTSVWKVIPTTEINIKIIGVRAFQLLLNSGETCYHYFTWIHASPWHPSPLVHSGFSYKTNHYSRRNSSLMFQLKGTPICTMQHRRL